MTASSREIAAAALLRAAVDDMLTRTSLDHLITVEPFCAEILKVATFLAPDNLDLDMEAAKTAFLAKTCGVGELAVRRASADRAMAVRNDAVEQRRLG